MALRGWRLFGVAGTILAYISGILLLSIISLNNPNQHRLRNGRFGDSYEMFRSRDNVLSRQPPLHWCQPLKYLNDKMNVAVNDNKKGTLNVQMQTLPEDFFKKYEKYLKKENFQSMLNDAGKVETKPFDDRYIDNNNSKQSSNKNLGNEKNDEIQITYEKIRPNTRNQRKKMRKKGDEISAKGLTALASFPGSGNTWLRYLLQQATGIYTGSVYKDFGLLKSGFPAESVSNSSVLVVKTHEWGPNAWQQFSRAILLVRDPDKSILAEFNRQSGGHVGFASPERYKRTKGRYWRQFVTNKLWAWEQMNLQWAKNFTGDVFVVYYDDLVENVGGTLKSILEFINFPINKELFECALARKEGIYRRKKRIMTFDPYTTEMHTALEIRKREVYSALGRYRFKK